MKLPEKLRSMKFSEYNEALEEVRNTLDEGGDYETEDVDMEYILGIYQLYKYPYEDIHALITNVMNAMMKHKKLLDPQDMLGLGTYASQYMKGNYDPGGFTTVMGSLEIAAKVICDRIHKLLSAKHPKEAKYFARYSEMLMQIEGACHLSYHILRKIGNRHLKVTKAMVLPAQPVFKSYILHALDAFPGDKAVIQFYKEYIAFFNKVKAHPEAKKNPTVKKEADEMIKEAQKYLKRVDIKKKRR